MVIWTPVETQWNSGVCPAWRSMAVAQRYMRLRRLDFKYSNATLESGDLTFVQLLEDDDLEDSSLIWDAHRAKLYAHRCGAWHKFAPVDETHRELRDEGTLLVTGPPGSTNCNVDVFMDSGGSFIHTVDPMSGQLQVLAFGTPSDLRHVQTLEVPGLKRALISNGDSHVYAATNRSLIVFERDAETGWLTETGKNDEGLWDLEAIVISSDDRYLFAFDGNGKRTTVFQLEDAPSNPQFLDTLPPFWNEPFWNLDNQCGFASARRGAPAVDVFCTNMAFGVRWQPETGLSRGNRPRCTVAAGSFQQSRARIRPHSKLRGESRWQARIPEH